MKKAKFIIGISLIAQSVAFIVLFFILWGKKKSLAKTFAAISLAGGVAGTLFLLSDAKDKKALCCCDNDFCEYDEDDEFDFFDDDDLTCSFEDEEIADEDIAEETDGE